MNTKKGIVDRVYNITEKFRMSSTKGKKFK